jgi:hypothetical protein
MRGHPIYETWVGMRSRCRNPNVRSYRNYGGRGIRVCERWHVFEKFRDDMLPTWQPGLTLDRINNALGYFPDNCRWATPKQQAMNTRANHLVATPWGKITLEEAAERSGLNYSTLWLRVKSGWTKERLFAPLRRARFLDTPWGRIKLTEASERTGVTVSTLCYRVARGWPEGRLFAPPHV